MYNFVFQRKQNPPTVSLVSVTVDVVAVIEVLIIEGRTGWHQLLQPHLSDEEAARQVKMLQERKSSSLRQSPETHTAQQLHVQPHAHQQWERVDEHW